MNFKNASVTKLIYVWNYVGDTYLNLTSSGGFIEISFTLRLVHLGTLFEFPFINFSNCRAALWPIPEGVRPPVCSPAPGCQS